MPARKHDRRIRDRIGHVFSARTKCGPKDTAPARRSHMLVGSRRSLAGDHIVKVARSRPTVAAWLLLVAAVALWPLTVPAHDIPSDVTIRMFLKPDGNQALLL